MVLGRGTNGILLCELSYSIGNAEFSPSFCLFYTFVEVRCASKSQAFCLEGSFEGFPRDNLCKRGIHVLNDDFGCAFCFQVDESINHILFVCPRVSYVW